MSQQATLFGVSYAVPETKDKLWGPTVTSLLLQLMQAADGLGIVSGSTPIARLKRGADLSLTTGGTIAWTAGWHRVQGSGAPVTLSASVAIAAGGADGQLLVLTGKDATNTVRLNDGGNLRLNGDIILALGDSISLLWDNTDAKWLELDRNS